MTANGALQLLVYIVVLIVLAKPLGAYMARVYEGRPIVLGRILGWLERLIYGLCGVRPNEEMGWKPYAIAMLLFNFLGFLVFQHIKLTLNHVGNAGSEPKAL